MRAPSLNFMYALVTIAGLSLAGCGQKSETKNEESSASQSVSSESSGSSVVISDNKNLVEGSPNSSIPYDGCHFPTVLRSEHDFVAWGECVKDQYLRRKTREFFSSQPIVYENENGFVRELRCYYSPGAFRFYDNEGRLAIRSEEFRAECLTIPFWVPGDAASKRSDNVRFHYLGFRINLSSACRDSAWIREIFRQNQGASYPAQAAKALIYQMQTSSPCNATGAFNPVANGNLISGARNYVHTSVSPPLSGKDAFDLAKNNCDQLMENADPQTKRSYAWECRSLTQAVANSAGIKLEEGKKKNSSAKKDKIFEAK